MPDACRSCKATVLWATTPNGSSNPIDPEPSEKGNTLLLQPSGFGLLAVTLSGKALDHARERRVPLRTSHWASCPDRQQWREDTDAKREAARAG